MASLMAEREGEGGMDDGSSVVGIERRVLS